MSRHELARGNKGLWQRIEALVRSTLPRQARVIRTEGSSVWVKFLGDGADDPEAKFPSTVAGVPVATMGWVITLGGRKGLFVVTGVYPDHQHSRLMPDPGSFTLTGGSSTRDGTAYTFTNLKPGHQYYISAQAEVRTTGAAERRFFLRAQATGASVVLGPGGATGMASRSNEVETLRCAVTANANSAGEITVVTTVNHTSGTISGNYVMSSYTIIS